MVGTVAILATAGIVGTSLFTQNNATSTNTASSQTASSTTNTTTNTSTATSSYKDGTYTATKQYTVPHGLNNTLKATIVISSGKITSATTEDTSSDHESAAYISRFESALSSSATGQSLGSYSPSRIGGASLTTQAFADALSDIASQAHA